jgi:hypothetical protein
MKTLGIALVVLVATPLAAQDEPLSELDQLLLDFGRPAGGYGVNFIIV